MSDVFQEVEEGLRQDRASELWARFAPFVWGLLAIVVAGVAIRELMSARSDEAAQARSESFETAAAALEAGDYEAAATGLTELADAAPGLAPIAANLLAAARYEGNGDAAAAANALDGAAGTDSDDPFAQAALLKAAWLRVDEASLAEIESLLLDMAAEETAFGALALELIAAKAFAEGDIARARREFGYLRFAANAPQGVVRRAEIALAAMPPVSGGDDTPEDAETDSDAAATETEGAAQ